MKILIGFFAMVVLSGNALAADCEVMVFQPAEESAYMITNQISAESLGSKGLSVTSERDVDSLNFHFTLEVHTQRNAQGVAKAYLNVSSQKITACGVDSTPVISQTSGFVTTAIETANTLVEKLPTCEILKEIERKQLSHLGCEL